MTQQSAHSQSGMHKEMQQEKMNDKMIVKCELHDLKMETPAHTKQDDMMTIHFRGLERMHTIEGKENHGIEAMLDKNNNEKPELEIKSVRAWFKDGGDMIRMTAPVENCWFWNALNCRKFCKENDKDSEHWKCLHEDKVHQVMQTENAMWGHKNAQDNVDIGKGDSNEEGPQEAKVTC